MRARWATSEALHCLHLPHWAVSHLAVARAAGTAAGRCHQREVLSGQFPFRPLPNSVAAAEPAAAGLLVQQAWRRQNSEAAPASLRE